ncbi:MAG: DUF4405 domain-containing protein [Polyangia bacterium]|jgi:hypothetical protein
MTPTKEDAPSSATSTATPRRIDLVSFSNAMLYLVFCVLAATGLAMEFRFDDSNATLLGVAKREWARVHALTALSFLSLTAVHLWVNWPWLRALLARLRWATLVVMTAGMVILVTFLLAPMR